MPQSDGLTTLSDLFATRAFEVPPYQRAFAWEERPQLQDFIEDLLSHPRDGSRFFLGTILLTSTSEEDSEDGIRSYAIVDGQQRLTTVCIFACVIGEVLSADPRFATLVDTLRNLFLEAAVGGRRKFHTIKEDDGYFDRSILNAPRAVDQPVTPSQNRLQEAKKFFDRSLAGMRADEVARLARTLQSSSVLTYTVKSAAEGAQIFEFQNDRGKRLTDLEALKSFLMHGLFLHSGKNSEGDLQILQSDFADIYRIIERIDALSHAPDEDTILSYHCAAFEVDLTVGDGLEGWRHPKELVKKMLSDDLKNISDKTAWIKEFAGRLVGSYRAVEQILLGRNDIDALGSGLID